MAGNHERVELIVNGRPKEWHEDTITYEQVVELAYPGHHPPTEIFTVEYSHGPEVNPKGTMVKGQRVYVKSGMRFDVTPSNQS